MNFDKVVGETVEGGSSGVILRECQRVQISQVQTHEAGGREGQQEEAGEVNPADEDGA